MSNKVTLKKISEMADVSTATVSRVINGNPSVSEAIKTRVLDAIRTTGYQPNPAARSLAGGRSRVLGLIVPETTAVLFADPYYARLTEGAAAAAVEQDYVLSLILFHALEDETHVVSRILRQHVLDGVVLVANRHSPSVEQLQTLGIPFVLVGRVEQEDVSFVDTDNWTGAYTAVTYLIRRGFKRIATITGPDHNHAARQRRMAYEQALRDRGYPLVPHWVATGDFSEMSGMVAMQQLLAGPPPEAVFVASDTMAVGAMKAITRTGLRVPQDIALVGFDDLPLAETCRPPLTTIRQPIRRVGRLAVETLLDLLDHGREPARRLVLPTELVIRASCGAWHNQEALPSLETADSVEMLEGGE